jgi:hypothetical protein
VLVNDPNAADWIEAIATVVAAGAAIFAGVFAVKAWGGTKDALSASQAALAIEQDRRADERRESEARARAVASRLDVVYDQAPSSDWNLGVLVRNFADVPFEDVKVEVIRPDDQRIRWRVASINPRMKVLLWFTAQAGWAWTVRYTDGEGRRWVRSEMDAPQLAERDHVAPEALPLFRELTREQATVTPL